MLSVGAPVSRIAGATAIGQVVALAASPILTRLYSPAEFGVLSIFASILSIVWVASALRYDEAIPLARTQHEAALVFVLCVVAVAATTSACLAVVLWGREFIAGAFGGGAFPMWPLFLPAGFAAAGLSSTFTYWCIRQQRYERVARISATQSLGGTAVQLVCGLFGAGSAGLLLGFVVSRGAGILSAGRSALSEILPELKTVRAGELWKAAAEFKAFPLYMVASAALNNVALNATILLLAKYYGPTTAGLFYLTQKTVSAPATLVGSAVSQVFIGQAAEALRTNPTSVRSLFQQSHRRLLTLAAGPAVAGLLLGEPVFRIVFGPTWALAGTFVQILSPVLLLRLTTAPINLQLMGRQKSNLAWTVSRVAITVGAVVLSAWRGESAIVAVGLYAFGMSASYGVKYVLWYQCLHELERDVSHVRAATARAHEDEASCT